jgi:HEAT repeat protein
VTIQPNVAAIESAIDQLYAHRRSPDYEPARAEFLKDLSSMAPSRLEPLLSIAESRLQQLGGADDDVGRLNYGLHLIFDFFEGRRLAQIRTLVERALQTERFRMKERYIQTLEEFGDPASLPTLVTLLSLHRGTSDDEEDIRTAVLNALTGYFPPLADPSVVLDCLSDESPRVRRAAIRYVSAHPADRAGATLALRASNEDDPDLLVDVLNLLEQTDPTKALASAEDRLASTPSSEAEIIELLQHTVERLRAKPY